MLEAKKDNLSLYVERTSLVGDVAVSISFDAKANSCCLMKLQSGCGCECFPEGSEECCVCYALFLAVRQSLSGDPVATAKSKVCDVACGLNDGEFSISWRVKGTGSAVRKSLGIALKCLAPSKMYSGYSQCIKVAGGKPNRDHFNYAANSIHQGIKKGVHCGVVGNIRTHKNDPNTKKEIEALDLNEMLKVLNGKLPDDKPEGGKANKEHVKCDHSNMAHVKVAGVDAVFLKDYIQHKLKAVIPVICDDTVHIPVKASVWETASKKLKGGHKDYVELKYGRVKNDLGAVLGYRMLATAEAGVMSVHKMLKSKITSSDVEKALSKSL